MAMAQQVRLPAQPPPATCRGVFLKRAVRAGDVYVFEPKSAVAEPNGIERWTDGVSWNPSKNKDYFLYYDEKARQLPAVESGERHYYLLKRTYAATVTPQPGAVPRELHLVWYAARDDAHNHGLVHIRKVFQDTHPSLAHPPADIDLLCIPKRNVRRATDRQRRERRRTLPGSEDGPLNGEQGFAGPVLLSHTRPSIDAIATDAPMSSPPGLFLPIQTTPRRPAGYLPPLAPMTPAWEREESMFTRRELEGPSRVTPQRRTLTLSMGTHPGESPLSQPPAYHQPPGLRPLSSCSSSSSSSPGSDADDALPERMRGDVPPSQWQPLFGSQGVNVGGTTARPTFYIPLPPLKSSSCFGESGAILPDVQDMPVVEHYQKRDESDDRMLQQLEKYFHI
uniref:Gti1/Pac2 family-domain-containing protein n=1 Tax=Schizophyllum commune (strain H4-8 / FGSC 9210) TaxID=578458 RepID=D8QBC8_SCHCM